MCPVASRMFVSLLLAGVILVGGCAAARTPTRTEAPFPSPVRTAEPASFRLSAKLTVHLPPQLVVLTGLPETLRGTLEADARSETVAARASRSRHAGHLTLKVADETAEHSLADLDIEVGGEADGSPIEGLKEVARRFADAATLVTQPLSRPGPTTQKSPR